MPRREPSSAVLRRYLLKRRLSLKPNRGNLLRQPPHGWVGPSLTVTEDERIDNISTARTPPSTESEQTAVIANIFKDVFHHETMASKAAHRVVYPTSGRALTYPPPAYISRARLSQQQDIMPHHCQAEHTNPGIPARKRAALARPAGKR